MAGVRYLLSLKPTWGLNCSKGSASWRTLTLTLARTLRMEVYKPSLPETPKLTRAEQHLVDQAVLGEWAKFPIDGDEPEAELKTIRPKVLQRLCANPPPEWPVHAYGVRMRGATISGDLDLGAAKVPHPLFFQDCHIAGRLLLRDARTRSSSLG